jgi:hypothetical protein
VSLIVRNLKAGRSVKILDSAKMFFVVFDVVRLRGCSRLLLPDPVLTAMWAICRTLAADPSC